MKHLISLKFPTNKMLLHFKQRTNISNCVIVENMLSCDLTDKEIELAKMMGGMVLGEVWEPEETI